MLGKYRILMIDRLMHLMSFLCVFMPEKGWYSLTIWLSTAKMIGEMAKIKKIFDDKLNVLNNITTIYLNEKVYIYHKLIYISQFKLYKIIN